MTDALAPVLIPYSRFVECRERRLRRAAKPTHPDAPRTIDAEAFAVAVTNDVGIRDAARFLRTQSAAGVEQS